MYNTTHHLYPAVKQFSWGKFVYDTIDRRKASGLTQKKHAELAGVSIPTLLVEGLILLG